jgi:hypothetical protein
MTINLKDSGKRSSEGYYPGSKEPDPFQRLDPGIPFCKVEICHAFCFSGMLTETSGYVIEEPWASPLNGTGRILGERI